MKYKITITKKSKTKTKVSSPKTSSKVHSKQGTSPEKQRKMEELALLREQKGRGSKKKDKDDKEDSEQDLFTSIQSKKTKSVRKPPKPPPPQRRKEPIPQKQKPIIAKKSIIEQDQFSQKIIDLGLFVLLIGTPLAAGSVNDWSILMIQLLTLLMAVVYLWMKTKPGQPEYLLWSLKWRKYFFYGFLLFLFIQILPLPKFLIKLFSPAAYSFRMRFDPGFATSDFMSFSVIPSHTLQQGLHLATYILLGFIIIKTVTTRRRIIRFFTVIIGMGVFQAFYGMFELFNKNPRILFYKKIHTLDAVTGTFVNRNHLSGYLEMAIPIAIGLIISRINLFSMEKMKLREKLLRLSEKGLSTNLLMSLGVFIMALGIILSRSRSGVFLLVFSFLLFFELVVLFMGKTLYRMSWTKNFLLIMFIGITIVSLYIGIGATVERFSMDRLLYEGRATVWSNTAGIARDFPLFGSGLGTFNSIYSSYENISLPSHYSHAHNDYLEYFAESGFLGMFFLLGGIVFILVTTFLVWRGRRHLEAKGVGMGGIVAVICMLIHSIADFNLHIPANMLLFTVILALTYNTVFYKFTKPRE